MSTWLQNMLESPKPSVLVGAHMIYWKEHALWTGACMQRTGWHTRSALVQCMLSTLLRGYMGHWHVQAECTGRCTNFDNEHYKTMLMGLTESFHQLAILFSKPFINFFDIPMANGQTNGIPMYPHTRNIISVSSKWFNLILENLWPDTFSHQHVSHMHTASASQTK